VRTLDSFIRIQPADETLSPFSVPLHFERELEMIESFPHSFTML
jgi:hypothetical protein